MTVEELVKKDSQMCSLPMIFYQIMEAVDDPDSSFQDIANLIGTDVALTSRLLKIVNSPFYGFSQKIETISHALNIVGTEQLCHMVLATSVLNKFRNIPIEFVTMESFWAHCIATGLAAHSLGKMKSDPNCERLYVGGMIHEVGSLIMYKNMPDESREALTRCNEWGQNLCEAEKEIFGFDHTDAGGYLAREWKLPEVLQECIGFHHRPLEAPTYKKEAAMVHIGDHIAQDSQLGTSGEMRAAPVDPGVWELLELDPEIVKTLPEEIFEKFEKTVQMFQD